MRIRSKENAHELNCEGAQFVFNNLFCIVAALGIAGACGPAYANSDDASDSMSGESAAPGPGIDTSADAAPTVTGGLEEVVVNGIRRGELIMPTTVTSSSAYGLDLGVMDTPRNNTVLSQAQIDALDVQNPGAFSYLTSSAYSDASFGQPNVPRVRGQYADMFFNGMRDSFTLNGYGAPVSFEMVDSIDIIKGPASVQGGPGSGVGGSIDIATKMPSMTRFTASASAEVDSEQKRIFHFDLGGPLANGVSARVSFTSNDSGSYYNDMFFHQQSLYAALVLNPSPMYTVSINGDVTDTLYRENDGINRVNQTLINSATYLTGAPPLSDVTGFGTEVNLTGTTQLDRRTNIDEPAGTGAHAIHAMLQLIQTEKVSDHFSIVNNTFYDYVNRYNQVMDYYADTAKGSFSIEDKTDFKFDYTGLLHQQIDTGFTYRYAHVLSIQNFVNDPVSVFDLSQNPDQWIFPASAQAPSGGAVPYSAAFGHVQYGLAASNIFAPDSSVDSDLQDAAIFLEHRMQFSPQLSVLYGLRGDLVQLNDSDPLYYQALANPATIGSLIPGQLPSQHTGWYGLYNGNISVVYSPRSNTSAYLTFNKAQYVLANDEDGAVNTIGLEPTTQLRQTTQLEEVGLKFDLLDKALFISAAGFHQQRAVPTGTGGIDHSYAHITGGEIEANFQPNSHLFVTASYSYLHTTLDTPSSFRDFPAQPGYNIDSAAEVIVWAGNQTFVDPGVPQHLFNALANYKLSSGPGVQANVQVTGPIDTTQSGYVNVPATEQALLGSFSFDSNPLAALPASVASTGYYNSPRIPWQYTVNVAIFDTFLAKYTVRFEVYNLTNERNLLNANPFYGNDLLTVLPPRSYDLMITARF